MLRPKAFAGLLFLAFAALALGIYVTFEFNQEPSNVFPEFLTPGERRQIRDELFGVAYAACLDHPLQRVVVLRLSLSSVSIVPTERLSSPGGESRSRMRSTPQPNAALQPGVPSIRRYNAVIQLYTLFAIPVGEVTIHESTNIYC